MARNVDVFYGEKRALNNVSVDIPYRGVMAFIGPSGCGKSTFLRCINRMNDTIPSARVSGASRSTAKTSTTLRSTSCSSGARRHGLPEAEPVPQIDLRERGLRAPHPRPRARQGRARRDCHAQPREGGAVQRGEGPCPIPGRPFRRPAAAPAYRARDRGQPRRSSWTSRARADPRSPRRASRSSSTNCATISASSSSRTRCSRPRACRSAPRSSTSACL